MGVRAQTGGKRSQSLGELLAKLERSGYITRSPSEADRRVIGIHLTDAGKKASSLEEQQPDNNELTSILPAFSAYGKSRSL